MHYIAQAVKILNLDLYIPSGHCYNVCTYGSMHGWKEDLYEKKNDSSISQ